MTTGIPNNKVFQFCLGGIFLILLSCTALSSSSLPEISNENSQPKAADPATPAPVEAVLTTSIAVPPGPDGECLAGIKPGQTTRSEALAFMGEPVSIEQKYGLEILLYSSSMRGQFHAISLKDQIVTRVVVFLDEDQIPAWSAQKNRLGEPAFTAYSDFLPGSMGYAYPELGVAFIADETMDAVFIKECFIPMPLADFQKTYGKVFSTENIFSR